MIVDAHLLLSEAQAITASAASDNIYDAAIARNLGVGMTLFVVSLVTTAFTDAGSDSTVEVRIQADNDVAFGSVDSFQIIGTFGALSAVGARLVAALQPDLINSRYFRAFYTVANGNLTTGAITTFLTTDAQLWTAYPDAVTIN